MKEKLKESKKYNTFAILFYINKSKIKKNGTTTIMGRISVSGEMTQFSTKIDIDPKLWDAKTYRLKGKSKETGIINRTLDALTNDITLHHQELIESQNYVTAELLKNKICNVGQKNETLLSLYAEHNADYEATIGISRAKSSYGQYKRGYRYVSEFIEKNYGYDLPLNQVNFTFIEQFDLFLRTKNFSISTRRGSMIALQRVIKRGINQGSIRKNPFVDYSFEVKPHRYRHMSSADLEKMMTTSISSRALCFTRDMFVFSTFTGISFVDLYNLNTSNLHQNNDCMWITLNRQKTNGECYIPLLEIPRKIIEKYAPTRKSDKVFNMVKHDGMQKNLAKVVKLCGIDSHVSYHDSRHNFGSLITLQNGVPLETICKMMGHNDLRTTEIYANLTNKKVNEDMKLIAQSTNSNFKLLEDKDMPILSIHNKNQ